MARTGVQQAQRAHGNNGTGGEGINGAGNDDRTTARRGGRRVWVWIEAPQRDALSNAQKRHADALMLPS